MSDAELLHALQQLDCCIRERDAVLSVGLRAWYRPDTFFKINVRPLHLWLVISIIADDVPGAGGRQDHEFEARAAMPFDGRAEPS